MNETLTLVERLRQAETDYTIEWGSGDLYEMAADEIERLTREREGWVSVPKEPTEAMIEAAMNRYQHGSESLALQYKQMHRENFRYDYKAMLSAVEFNAAPPEECMDINDEEGQKRPGELGARSETQGHISGASLTAPASAPKDDTITFSRTDDSTEILRLGPGGGIYVHGKLIENDAELVAGLREWLTACQSQAKNERAKVIEECISKIEERRDKRWHEAGGSHAPDTNEPVGGSHIVDWMEGMNSAIDALSALAASPPKDA